MAVEPDNLRLAQQTLDALLYEDRLWVMRVEQGLDLLLQAGLQGTAADVASVWCKAERDGAQMHCVAMRDREAGQIEPDGFLPQADFPAYFAALRSESCIAVSDALDDPRTAELVDSYLVPRGVRALLDIVVRREGRMHGVLCFEQRHDCRAWIEPERAFGARIGSLVSQALLLGEVRRRNRVLQVINSIGPRLGEARTVEMLGRVVIDAVRNNFGGLWAGVYRFHEDGGYHDLVASHFEGVPADLAQRARRMPGDRGMAARSIAQRYMIVERVGAAESSELLVTSQQRLAELGVKYVATIPLLHAERVLGFIGIWFRESGWIDVDELDVYASISSTVSVAMLNALHAEEMHVRERHDRLTGLPNRLRLVEDLDHAISDAAAHGALVLVDLKDFRELNNALGRRSADRILERLAHRVETFARGWGACAYRLSGAAFGLLFHGEVGVSRAWSLAASLQRALAVPIDLDTVRITVKPHCGMTLLPPAGAKTVEILRSAEVALGWAEADENRLAFYDAERDLANPGHFELLEDLRRAVTQGGLSLHYQPKLDLASGRVCGCEALLRWNHPRLGRISPERIVAVAEAGELMPALTLWVARSAIAQAAALRAAGYDLSMAINVSVQNMVDDEFPSALHAVMAAEGCPVSAVRLEITETVLMKDPERALPVIERLAPLGVALDIDDFGTGYSSLAYLRHLPLAALKIDRTFVTDLLSRHEDEVIVRSTVDMAHNLGLRVVAEGVEDAATLEKLRALGVDEAQGYHLSRPLEAQALREWLAQWR